jgi:manganese/zinc/iron transport system permease protein
VNWSDLDTWIVLAGALTAMACALPGVFLQLNKQSMLGDAISHAVLPGIAIAYLVSGSKDTLPLLVGALAAGVLTAILSSAIHRLGHIEHSASLGVVFCIFFAAGLVLVRLAADRVELDPSCVLFGSLELAVLESNGVPKVVWLSALTLALNALVITIFFKELRLSAFDSRYAATAGIPPETIRIGLAVLTSITAVMAFESVGSILVVAMLIVPGATALLVCRSVRGILFVSLGFAALASICGHLLAISTLPALLSLLTGNSEIGSVSSAGMMAASSGLVFFAILLARSLHKPAPSPQPGVP